MTLCQLLGVVDAQCGPVAGAAVGGSIALIGTAIAAVMTLVGNYSTKRLEHTNKLDEKLFDHRLRVYLELKPVLDPFSKIIRQGKGKNRKKILTVIAHPNNLDECFHALDNFQTNIHWLSDECAAVYRELLAEVRQTWILYREDKPAFEQTAFQRSDLILLLSRKMIYSCERNMYALHDIGTHRKSVHELREQALKELDKELSESRRILDQVNPSHREQIAEKSAQTGTEENESNADK